MSLPPLQLIDDSCFFISGNVTVHPSAVIAPSVLLQADPGSQLMIAAGVCIGRGTVLHAHAGTLEVEAGVILGSGVLVVGQGKIGTEACIGAMTTIIDSSIAPHQSIPPGSLIGDKSRSVPLSEVVESTSGGSVSGSESVTSPPPEPSEKPAPSPPPSSESTPQPPSSAKPTSSARTPQVYGRAYLERMIITMFPHNRPLGAEPEDSPPSAST